jgi:ABC-2 type transport system permease protein
MIMIGGVGIPLAALPGWAQRLSGFMPGRYAVDVLQRGYTAEAGDSSSGFSILALVVIGLAGAVSGARLFRWDEGRRLKTGTWVWVLASLLSWLAVGGYASRARFLEPIPSASDGYQAVTERQIAGVSYEYLPGDEEFVSRLSKPFGQGGSMSGLEGFKSGLERWSPGHIADAGQSARNLLCLAGIADVSEDPHEGEIARLVFNELQRRHRNAELERILTWIILYPKEGSCLTTVPELGLNHQFREDIVRERTVLYAKKFLGRLRGLIRD